MPSVISDQAVAVAQYDDNCCECQTCCACCKQRCACCSCSYCQINMANIYVVSDAAHDLLLLCAMFCYVHMASCGNCMLPVYAGCGTVPPYIMLTQLPKSVAFICAEELQGDQNIEDNLNPHRRGTRRSIQQHTSEFELTQYSSVSQIGSVQQALFAESTQPFQN